jgi:hypothetical protein
MVVHLGIVMIVDPPWCCMRFWFSRLCSWSTWWIPSWSHAPWYWYMVMMLLGAIMWCGGCIHGAHGMAPCMACTVWWIKLLWKSALTFYASIVLYWWWLTTWTSNFMEHSHPCRVWSGPEFCDYMLRCGLMEERSNIWHVYRTLMMMFERIDNSSPRALIPFPYFGTS